MYNTFLRFNIKLYLTEYLKILQHIGGVKSLQLIWGYKWTFQWSL